MLYRLNPRSLRTGLAAVAIGALASLAPGAARAQTPVSRPNIIFVLLDDAGFSDFGAYGSEIDTPNIDAIARDGVRFTNFHTASTCEASRTMLHSGLDPHRGGAGTLQVVIADNQRGKPGYEGYLSDSAFSLGELMRAGGYTTYFVGKWNIGPGVERAPGARGWDRYLSLENTGADNYEARVYAPFNLEAVWWEDGRRASLPADFYSSRYYTDRLIRFIDEGRAAKKPFMATLAFQAVHSPLQVPQSYIDKYLARYQAGWEQIRKERYERQVRLGLLPPGLPLPKALEARDWNALGADEKRMEAKKMAVFAGMLEAADAEIGRLRDHLRRIGELDNTVFIVMSDNGADAVDLSRLNLPFRIWYRVHNDLGYDALGGKGSYVHYGQDWAEVSNTPLNLFKGTSGEGGLRVPFIISAPGRTKGGTTTDVFAWATDFLPTVLDLGGVAMPGPQAGKIAPTGKSLMPALEGKTPAVHGADEIFGFEGTGGQAVYKGGYKLMRNGPPLDGRWHLYATSDITEMSDLAAANPQRVAEMKAAVDAYNAANGVVLPEAGYNPLVQLLKNNSGIILRQLGPILIVLVLIALLPVAALLSWIVLRRRKLRRLQVAPSSIG